MEIDPLLSLMVNSKASDMHLKAGYPPILRIDGKLVRQSSSQKMTADNTREIFESLASDEQLDRFYHDMDIDFAYSVRDIIRFRVNAYVERGTIGLVFHLIPTDIPSIERLGLPNICKCLVMKTRGLVIVTGPTGSGKSTTLAAMLGHLNDNVARRIVTIEDPIEFIHIENKCVFSQRELGPDATSYATALRASLRQDPDVIMVGEARDAETMAAALTAAETGHLVITTLHTPSAAQAVDRIIDSFPSHNQQQIRAQLATVIECVLHQTLVPKLDSSGRIAAVEIMLPTTGIRHLIREGRTFQIQDAIDTGTQYGMQTMDRSLADLWSRELISEEDALARSEYPAKLKKMFVKPSKR